MVDMFDETDSLRSLSDQAYVRIRDEIILCRLVPGEVISESIVEERYDLARASVRHALMRLSQERFIKTISKKTRVVAPLTIGEIHDVFLLRRTLEPLAAKLAAGNVNEAQLRILDEACRKEYPYLDDRAELGLLEANRRFHLTIAQASGSFRLVQLLEQLHNEAARMLYLGVRNHNKSEQWSEGHERLLEALTQPSATDAERIALELLDNSLNEIMQEALANPAIRDASLV